nr:hypothetical protein [Cressdnaviricota sp.]
MGLENLLDEFQIHINVSLLGAGYVVMAVNLLLLLLCILYLDQVTKLNLELQNERLKRKNEFKKN